jgi:hypothetical protein
MKLLDIYVEHAGTRVDLKMKPNDDVVTYLVFVRKFTTAGPLPEVTWFPEDLETTGCSITLAAERGYDIILKATGRPGGHAAIDPLLVLHDAAGSRYTDRIDLPEAEGPVVERGWSIAIR